MDLKLSKTVTCRLAAKGKWGNLAAAWMGLSFFLRMVYYFGLMNLNDIPMFEIIFSVVLPIVISVAFILTLKLPRLQQPIIAGGLSAAFAVNYFFATKLSLGGVISGILVLGLAVLILGAVLGYVPDRKWLLWCAMAAFLFRALFVDLFGFILPLTEWNILAWIPEASNLFGITAMANLAAAMRLRNAE